MEQVAVIVSVHNGERFLEQTLRSILDQTYNGFRLYIVDDGSTDTTPVILQKYAAHPRVTCVSQSNCGQAAALNRALRAGQEPLVAACDADDLWREDRLEKAVRAFKAQPEVGLVCNDYCLTDRPDSPWVSAWRLEALRPVSGYAFDRLLEVNFIQRSGVLLPREQLERFHGFSEQIGGKCGCDDLDMWLRIARYKKILCLDDILTCKRVWGSQESKSLHFLESQVRLWERWVGELRDGPARHYRRAKRNLGAALFDLGYCQLKRDQSRAKAYAALLGAAKYHHRVVRALGLIGLSMLRLV
jgi:glycosyltransferase involved in cell wall biosynthesis